MSDISSTITAFKNHYQPLAAQIRDGNEPFILDHGEPTEHAIVLSHGLTDSPHFMKAIGNRFHNWGFNVVAHLVPGHGLTDPSGASSPAKRITAVDYSDWVNEVAFSAEIASHLGNRVSMACLSTGGPLNLHHALRHPGAITGGLFFFSAALDIGDWKEFALRLDGLAAAASIADKKKAAGHRFRQSIEDLVRSEEQPDSHYGIGDNPYRYSVMFKNGASQLAELIKQIEDHYAGQTKYGDIDVPVFIAHSHADTTAGIGEMQKLKRSLPSSTESRIFELNDVSHASVVLEDDITAPDDQGRPQILEKRNPKFNEMMTDVKDFVGEALQVS